MSNPFRDKTMREVFAESVAAYENKARLLFLPSGARCMGNGYATNFWRGFDNNPITARMYADKQSRKMIAYAAYRAGLACSHKT